LDIFQADRKLSGDCDFELIQLGSCGLHVVNGAFRMGNKKSGWDIEGFLRAFYSLFKDSPARRAKFLELTENAATPKKFCAIRWTENIDIVDRALELLPSLRIYVNTVTPKPDVRSYNFLDHAIRDPLLEAKLHFFRHVASILQPFLTTFQTPKPMAPMLADACEQMIRKLLSFFIKASVLTEAKTRKDLLKIDINPQSGKTNYN